MSNREGGDHRLTSDLICYDLLRKLDNVCLTEQQPTEYSVHMCYTSSLYFTTLASNQGFPGKLVFPVSFQPKRS